MARVRIYVDGRPAWSENVPASAPRSRIGGEMIVGESQTDRDRRVNREWKARKAAKAAE